MRRTARSGRVVMGALLLTLFTLGSADGFFPRDFNTIIKPPTFTPPPVVLPIEEPPPPIQPPVGPPPVVMPPDPFIPPILRPLPPPIVPPTPVPPTPDIPEPSTLLSAMLGVLLCGSYARRMVRRPAV